MYIKGSNSLITSKRKDPHPQQLLPSGCEIFFDFQTAIGVQIDEGNLRADFLKVIATGTLWLFEAAALLQAPEIQHRP